MTRPLAPRVPKPRNPGRAPLPSPRSALLAAAAVALVFALLTLLHSPTTIGASAPAAASSYSVQITNYAYSPASINVNEGDTITWTNQDTVPHTVTTSSGPQTLSSPDLSKGQSWSFTFTQPGTYSYYCAVHPYMRAQVIVRAPAPATSAAAPVTTRAAAQPQTTYVVRTRTSQAAVAPVVHPSTKPASSAASASASAAPSATSSSSAAAVVQSQNVAADSNIRTLSPVLLLGGLAAAIAVFCLLLVGSRAAAPRPDSHVDTDDS